GGVEAFAAARTVDRIEFSARADLHQELSVRRIFLDAAVGIAGDPDVALLIDEAAMDRAGNRGLVAPRSDHVAVGVESDDRRRGDRRLLLLVGDVAAVYHLDLVLRAPAHPPPPARGSAPPPDPLPAGGALGFRGALRLGAAPT